AYSISAFAAGKIVGTVKDGTSEEALIGVSVSLKKDSLSPTIMGTVTDIEGNFTIEAQAGTYELEFRYLGFQTKIVTDVLIQEGQLTSVPVSLSEPKSTEIEEVVIRGTLKRESINALYTIQKNAVAVSSGIS